MDDLISEKMNQISAVIVQAEKKMRERNFHVSCFSQDLKWEPLGTNFRIVFEHKPLVEHTFEVRVKLCSQIPGLIDVARELTTKRANYVAEMLQKVSDAVEDL